MNPYITSAQAQKMPPGLYTLYVRFLVEKDGSVKDIMLVGPDPGYGLAKGAVEMVKTGPKWKPGIQNGSIVRSYKTQPITFVISQQ